MGENPAEQALAFIEATHYVAELLDTLKTNLEDRGWSPAAAEQAATVLGNTILIKGN